MSDYRIPELPSDEELGIEDEESPSSPPAAAPPPAEDAPGKKRARTPSGSVPARPWRGPLTLAVLLVLAWLTGVDRALPDAAPLDAPDSAFSSGRAMMDVVAVSRRAHPPGSPEHARVRDFLLARLQELGLSPEVQTATVLRRRGGRVTAVTVRNVLARIPGTASTGAIALVAHYDARGVSRGAGDDGSGVAAILETLRALASGPPLRNDLLVILTDAEELGLVGARAFVGEHPWMEDVALVLNVDMRGAGGPSIMFRTGADDGWIVGALKAGDPRPFANALSLEVYRHLPNDTDFTPFRDAGVQGLDFASVGRPHVYHQAWDAPQRLDERALQHEGLHLLGMVRELGGRDLSDVDAPDTVFFRLPVLGLVTYPPAVGYGLALALVIVGGLAFALVRRGGGAAGGVLVGFAVGLVIVGTAAGAAHFLFLWLRGFHPEYGALRGSAFHVEGWYVAAIVAGALALSVLLLHLTRRRFGLGALGLGVVAVPVILAIVVTFVAPMGASNLQWPALLALVGVILAAGVGPGGRTGLLPWLVQLALAAVILAFTVPVVELLWVTLSLQAALAVGAVVGLAVVLVVPLTDVLREPGGWWVPVGGLLAAAALVGVGLLHARPTPDRPLPSTLVYLLDRDAGAARWATVGDGGAGWAAQRTGLRLDTAEARTLDGWFLAQRPYLTGPAPVATAPRPEVRASVSMGDGGQEPAALPGGDMGAGPATGSAPQRRTLRLALRSAVGAEMIGVILPPSADAYLRRVAGRPVPDEEPGSRSGARRAGTVVHWGEPDGSLVLELDVGPGLAELPFTVVEQHLRPGELVGERYFLRPPNVAPDVTTLSDRATLRGTVRVDMATGAVTWPAPTPEGEPGGGGPAALPFDSTAVDSVGRPAVDTLTTRDTLTTADTLKPADTLGIPGGDGAPPQSRVRVSDQATPRAASASPRARTSSGRSSRPSTIFR